MTESRYARKPLLYIQQPKIHAPSAQMQSSYRSERSKRVKKVAKEEKNIFHEQLLGGKKRISSDSSDQLKARQDEAVEEEVQLSVEPEQQLEEKAPLASETADIPFKDLDIRGKIAYFLNKPSDLPNLKCEVRTKDHVHHGVITKFKDDMVFLQKKRRENITQIPFASIQTIKLLGF